MPVYVVIIPGFRIGGNTGIKLIYLFHIVWRLFQIILDIITCKRISSRYWGKRHRIDTRERPHIFIKRPVLVFLHKFSTIPIISCIFQFQVIRLQATLVFFLYKSKRKRCFHSIFNIKRENIFILFKE